jgi:hypothetical protein
LVVVVVVIVRVVVGVVVVVAVVIELPMIFCFQSVYEAIRGWHVLLNEVLCVSVCSFAVCIIPH